MEVTLGRLGLLVLMVLVFIMMVVELAARGWRLREERRVRRECRRAKWWWE